jgi:hypothetical protein
MTKAEEIALQELKATPDQYITKEEFNSVENNCFEKTQLYNLGTTYAGNILSVSFNKYKYYQITIQRQEMSGEWITDSAIYFKQPYMSPEDIREMMERINSRPSYGPVDCECGSCIELKRDLQDNFEIGDEFM